MSTTMAIPNAGITIYNNIALNTTLLNNYNLHIYSGNHTLSNTTVCYYLGPPSSPTVKTGMTVYNDTGLSLLKSCSDPVLSIGTRGVLGIVFGCLFLAVVGFVLVSLQRVQLRRRGRNGWAAKWPYYVVLLAAVVGAVAGFIAVDVDREVVTGVSFEIQAVFYGLLVPLGLLGLFEVQRYWVWVDGWKGDRDRNVYVDLLDGRGALGSTVLFYILDLAGLFIVSLRDWGVISKQWYELQVEIDARPAATDARFQAGRVLSVCCLLIIALWLVASWLRYRVSTSSNMNPGHRDRLVKLTGAFAFLAVSVVYNVMAAYSWKISPYNAQVKPAYYYGYGLCPVIVALIILNTITHTKSDESLSTTDSVVSGHPQRIRKPSWWRQSRFHTSSHDMISLDLKTIKNARGREEKFQDADRRWWWQSEAEQSGHVKKADAETSDHLSFGGKMKEREQKQERLQPSGREIANSQMEGTSRSLSQPNSRHRSQHMQQPVRSMLDV